MGSYRLHGDRLTVVSDLCQQVHVDSFVAFSIEISNKLPVIGKVLKKLKKTERIHYWKGS